MATHLISFLGTGKYEETIYTFEEKECKTQYVAYALADITRPRRVSILATQEARDKHERGLTDAITKAGLPQPEYKTIPTGGEPDQLWEMFEAIVYVLRSDAGTTAILDITHGFRMQPFFAAACIQYVQSVLPNVPTIRVVYGEFRGSEQRSPIWELTPFLEVLSWSRSLMMFLRTGQANEVVGPTKALGNQLNRRWVEGGRQGQRPKLEQLAERLKRFSDDFCTLRTGSLLVGTNSSVRKLLEVIDNTRDEVRENLPILEPVLERLREMIQPLGIGEARFSSRKGQEALLALARLYERMGRYSEAYAILREGWISLGAPPEADTPSTKEFNFTVRKQWDKTWVGRTEFPDEVSDPRNDLLHAGFRSDPSPAESITKKLSELLHKWQHEIRALST